MMTFTVAFTSPADETPDRNEQININGSNILAAAGSIIGEYRTSKCLQSSGLMLQLVTKNKLKKVNNLAYVCQENISSIF